VVGEYSPSGEWKKPLARAREKTIRHEVIEGSGGGFQGAHRMAHLTGPQILLELIERRWIAQEW
jgi:hypothetical protein